MANKQCFPKTSRLKPHTFGGRKVKYLVRQISKGLSLERGCHKFNLKWSWFYSYASLNAFCCFVFIPEKEL